MVAKKAIKHPKKPQRGDIMVAQKAIKRTPKSPSGAKLSKAQMYNNNHEPATMNHEPVTMNP